MVLTDNQAKEILMSPRHKQELASCKLFESQLRVFTEEYDKHELQKEPYWKMLQKTIESRVAKKYKRVCDFIRYPLPVVQITDSIIGDYYKVFDGKNKYFNVEGDRDLTRLKTWINEKSVEQWIEDNARSVFKNKPCSFVVIDSVDGEPTCILIDSSRIVDAEFTKEDEGPLEYIAFIHSVIPDPITKKPVVRYAVYDDENYHVFIKDDKGEFIKDEEFTSTHKIGYCPATAFIQETNNSKNQYKRRTAFGSSVSKLEDWTIFDIFRNYVDHYAPFPVTESIVKKCGNPKCEDGAIKSEETIIDGPKKGQTRTKYTKCEVCDGSGRASQYVGPGTHIKLKHMPAPNMDDGSGKFRMIFPETDKLKYVPEKLDDLEIEIRYKTVGVNTMISKEAINEMQAKGSFLSMETVLLRNKTMLDKLYVFIVTTSGRMLYTNLNVKVDANHGTEWYLMTEKDLQDSFDNAKKIGMPINEVTSIYKQLIETKYANNKSKRDHELMLVDLQDYPFYSIDEVIKLKQENTVDGFQLSLKTNFHNFVSRFERENGPVTLFGLSLDYSRRIQNIKETIEGYNTELLKQKADRIEQPNDDDDDDDDITED